MSKWNWKVMAPWKITNPPWLPETNIARENQCLEDYFSFGKAFFISGYVSFW